MNDRLAAGIARWRARAADEFPGKTSSRRQAATLGIATNTYNDWLKKATAPSHELMLQFHLRTNFKLGEQTRLLFGVDDHELDIRVPLWEPRLSAEHLLESLRNALRKSHTTTPSVFDIGEALLASCRQTGDLGRWRARQFDVPGGWHFPHVAFEAVEFMRWYGPDAGVDHDPDRDTAARFLGIENGDIPDQASRFLTPAPLAEASPPATFEPGVHAASRARHWEQFRYERAELNKRLERIRGASRTGWVGGYGTLHIPLLRHSTDSTGRHIAIQQPVRPMDPEHAQTVPVVDQQGVRTILLLGTSAVSIGPLGTWLADALGWTSLWVEELNHRHSGQRILLLEMDRRDLIPAIYRNLARDPLPRTVLTIPLPWLHRDAREQPAAATRLPEAELLLQSERVLPILIKPTPETLALWEERQSLASAGGHRPSPHNRMNRVAELYRVCEDYLSTVPGAVVADVTATLPWAGDAVMAADQDDQIPSFYQHPLIGDMLLRVTYELGFALRSPKGIVHLRGQRPGGSRLEKATQQLRKLPGVPSGLSSVGFAPSSLVAQFEATLRAVTRPGQWADDDHLVWDSAYERPHEGQPPKTGRITRIRLVGPRTT
ncbi:hypothetical protein [Nocardioides sp. PD653]|uniref:hypothetical protein n=1 Tax=Nocardioides sp. PD653 TaxID=393303 RepID=UPI001056B347|nr:hypothetical protein [Nocardioides sp. PD653]